uniref:Ubiquitin-like protease family profile domain-containing protein n=1 Tax=Glossina pallidipes TaxID=7398 RepID=A0A1A9ZQJ5_GLOPL
MDRRFAKYLKVNISSGDFQQLLPGRWINDRIIEFYAQCLLKEQVTAGIRNLVHLFSQFLYAKIAQKTPNCVRTDPLARHHSRPSRYGAKRGTIYTINSLVRYPNEAIAINVRRYVEFLNMMKHGYDINTDENTMPMREVTFPLRGNQSDCGIFLLKNLEHYLGQSEAKWDPLTPPEAWCTRAEARQTRLIIAAVLLELAGMGGGEPISPAELTGTSDQIDDVTITTPAEPPVTLRAMAAITEARTFATEGENSDNLEPIPLGLIKRRDTEEELSLIKLTIGLTDSATPARDR